MIIEVLTDNKNRAAGEIRHLLEKHGGNLAAPNAVAWMFHKKGYIVIEKTKSDEEKLMSAVLDAGADDLQDDVDNWEVFSTPEAFPAVNEAVKGLGIEPATAKVSMIPQNYVKLEGKAAQQMVKLMEALEEQGDRGLAGVRVFGIDPGSERTGYGCVETDGSRHRIVACGAVRVTRSASFSDKLFEIHQRLADLLAEHRPESVAIESIFYAANVRSALKLGHARGVAMLAAAQAGVAVVEYSPAEVKRAVVGYGRAEKHQVQHMIKLLLGLPAVPSPHDAADALAVAICHVHSRAPARALVRSARL
jgi:crossover junction endodeoxyribonuclease RuvC